MSANEQKLRARSLLVAVAALLAVLALAACDDEVGGGKEGEVQTARAGKPSGEATFSNWPGYIDLGKNGTVAEFEEKYGVTANYIEDVNDNVQFFGKLQPQLERGESGGRSLFVVTDWMAKQMYDLGYLQKIDYSDVPNVDENMTEFARGSNADPDREFTIPWQSGMTGIWVDKTKAPDIRSVNDLFDPKYKGQVTLLTEMRDTVPLVMKADGVDPESASKQDWLDSIDKIKQAAESGQIRRFTGNEYTEDLTAGNVVASIGWSGDASLIGNPDAEWRMPTEGCTFFTDSVVIPVGAPNSPAALAFANFVYDPKVEADIAAYVNYVPPVEGVKEVLTKEDPELANNELIFPSDEFTKDCTPQPEPPGSKADQQEVTEAFQDVITG